MSRFDLSPNPNLPPLERELQGRLLKLIDDFGGIARDSLVLLGPNEVSSFDWQTFGGLWSEALSAAFTHEISEGNWGADSAKTGFQDDLSGEEIPLLPRDEDRYFVCWRSKITGKTGRGTESFPYSLASQWAAELNGECALLTHWLEPDTCPSLTSEESRTLALMHQLSDVSEAAGSAGESTLEDVLDIVTFLWEVGLIDRVERVLRPPKQGVRDALAGVAATPAPASASMVDNPGVHCFPAIDSWATEAIPPEKMETPHRRLQDAYNADRPMVKILKDTVSGITRRIYDYESKTAPQEVHVPVMDEMRAGFPIPTAGSRVHFSSRTYRLHHVIAADHWGPTEVEYRS